MRAVIQRVHEASVDVEGSQIATIGRGLLVFVGVAATDGARDVRWLADKVVGLRVFASADGKFDASVAEIGGAVLVVSQFTLYGDTRKGRRPSFSGAARPELAEPLYEQVAAAIAARGVSVSRGRFGAHMAVRLVNDGPVTLLLESATA
jgi:D-tyrosyl-tRNA(Tyr) deacylase